MSSSTFSTAWSMMPDHIRQKFYSVGNKGSWTGEEAFNHLVPDGLKDNPYEVEAFMDGGEVTVDVWNNQTKTYEEVTYNLPDRDVSRIEAGGEYSPDNTIMEDMSINRSRGAADMTDAQYEAAVEANAADESIIEAAFESATEQAATAADVTGAGTAAELGFGELLMDSLLPIFGSLKAGTFVASKCTTTEDKLGWGALAAGFGAIIMASPAGPVIAAGYTGYKVTELGFRVYDKHLATK